MHEKLEILCFRQECGIEGTDPIGIPKVGIMIEVQII
jgi:hypothetical protein